MVWGILGSVDYLGWFFLLEEECTAAADVKYMQRKLVFGGLLWAEHSCMAIGPNGHWSSQN